jgi:predicted alpha/beta-fold hydrolase
MKYIASIDYHGIFCFSVFTFVGIMEMIWSTTIASFFDFSEKPTISYMKNEKNDDILKHMPSVNAFNIAWFGRGKNAQTLLQSIASVDKNIKYDREIISTEDGVDISLDWKQNSEMNQETPIILCLHGLGGDSETRFMQTFTNLSLKKGFRAVVYNRRGHGGTSLLSRVENVQENVIFPKHVNMKDMVCVVDHLLKTYPLAPKYLIGFSCGANLAINYISKYSTFIATASVSNVYNIFEASRLLSETSSVCDGIVSQFLKDILSDGRLEEVKKIAKRSSVNIDFESVMRCKSIKKLEEMLVVPAYGFKSLKEYYESDSCHNAINAVKTPLLCIANRNDPLVHSRMVDIPLEAAKSNENIITVVTEHGGHLGWIESFDKDPWYADVFSSTLKTFDSYNIL